MTDESANRQATRDELNPIDNNATIKDKAVFLKEKIKEHVKGFEGRRKQNRKIAIGLSISSAIGGVTVTILLGLKIVGFESVFSTIALVLSGIVTLLNAIEALFDYRKLWIQYTVTANEFRALRDDLDYILLNGTDNIEMQQIDDLYERYKLLLKSTNSSWVNIREEQSSTTG